MAIGGFFKALGKGAKAVGRGAMKGVLGFDDRDISKKFKKKSGASASEPDEDDLNEDYSGYSRGVADLGTNEYEGDGLEASSDMETPPELGGFGEESLIGLEMPNLPGFKKKGHSGGGHAGGGVKIEAPKTVPTAYETVTAGQTPTLDIPGFSSMQGTIQQGLEGMKSLRGAGANSDYWGKSANSSATRMMGPGGEGGQNYGPEEMEGAAEGSRRGALTAGAAILGATSPAVGAMSAIPGLTRSAGSSIKGAGSKAHDWLKGPTGSEIPKGQMSPGYSTPLGQRVPGGPSSAPASGPGKATIEQQLAQFRGRNAEGGKYFEPGGPPGTQYAQELFPGGGQAPAGLYPVGPRGMPTPGMGGVEGPLPPLPPGIKNRFGKLALVE